MAIMMCIYAVFFVGGPVVGPGARNAWYGLK